MTDPAPFCSRCGTPVPPGARACSKCGADVSGQQGQVATAYTPPAEAARMAVTQGSLVDALRRATVGEYEIRGDLGHGGMASVYLAHEIALDRKVAIKVMSPALFSAAGMVERFKREARTAASLSHPHIIPIYAVRESPEIVYFVMKFIEGRSLESIVHQLGQMPIPLVQAILYQVGSALGYAHRRGVVHRDVKPANIMIDADGWSVVTDFGIAKVSESQGLTQTGATIGTPSYMSPEQCAAKRELTGASDQYSLGIVAYEMLGGQVPFQAETTVGLLFAHVHETPPPISDLRSDCPPEVATAVMHMLAKDPESRWPDIVTAVSELGGAPIGHDDPIRAQLVELAGGRAASPAETIRTPMSPVPRSRAAPSPATRTSAPKDRRPPTRTAMPPRAVAATPAPRRNSPLLWALPAVAVAGVGVWWLLGRGPTPMTTRSLSPFPVETVKVVERTPAETIRTTTPPPVATGDTQRQTGSAPATPPTPTVRRTPPSVRNQQAETAFHIAEARALGRRVRAAAAGARPEELAAGDADARAADALARQGHFAEATSRLATAIDRWSSAERNAQGRPRAGAGQGGGLRGEVAQAALEFADAFNTKSLPRIRQAYPGVTEQQSQEWGELFLRVRDVTMQLSVTGVERHGPGEAQATLDGHYDYTEMRGGTSGRQPVSWRATLRQTPMGWRIVALR